MKRHYIAFTTPETADIVTDSAPIPTSDEALIKVNCAGVNRADVLQMLGLYPPPEDASPIPAEASSGCRRAGCQHLSEGDRVCALTHGEVTRRSPHARITASRYPALDEQGAALPEALLTVWYNVFERGRLTEGETVHSRRQ